MNYQNDPTFGWRTLRYEVPPKLRIPVNEWPKLFEACQTPIETISLATGLYLFLRGSEQRLLKVGSVDLASKTILVERPKVKAYDEMPISAELDSYLRPHLTWLAENGWADKHHYLIPARGGQVGVKGRRGFAVGISSYNPLRPVSKPHHTIQRVLGRAGYETFREGEHTLRRSGARAYYDSLCEQGYDRALRRVMSMLGHKHSRMTEIYLGLDPERQARNAELAGKPMFPALADARIVQIRRGM
jgi:integrase